MGKTIYEKIKFGRSQSTPLKNNTEVGDWEESDKTLQNSAGDLLSNPEQRTITIPGQEDNYDGSGGYMSDEEWTNFLQTPQGQAYTEKHSPKISTEYRGDLPGTDPDMETTKTTTTEVTPERKRYNPGYYETVNRNMAEAAARRGSRRDTRRALRDLKKGLTREQKRELNENRSKLRSQGKLKGGADRKIQLLQSITKGGGVEGAENFGNRGADAARGKLDKTSKSYLSKLEGDTMDKSKGQLGNVQNQVTMDEAKTVTNVTETSKPIEGTGTKGQENVSGVVVTNNDDNPSGVNKNRYGKNKSPFKMGGPGSRAKGNYTPYNK